MSKAFIFGNGGHARVIASFLPIRPVFVVQQKAGDDTMSEDDYFAQRPNGDVYLGIGSNAARQQCAAKLRTISARMPPCVAPNAFVARDAILEDGAVICAGAIVGAGARIGRDVIVNTLSSVDHDCVVGELTQITVGVILGGTVSIGANCFLGMRSAVFPNKTIGSNAQIMAGSLVVSDVPANVMVGGNPAAFVRNV